MEAAAGRWRRDGGRGALQFHEFEGGGASGGGGVCWAEELMRKRILNERDLEPSWRMMNYVNEFFFASQKDEWEKAPITRANWPRATVKGDPQR